MGTETLHDGRAIRTRWLVLFWTGVVVTALGSLAIPAKIALLILFAGVSVAIGAGLKPLFAAGLDSRVLADATLRLDAGNRELLVNDEPFPLADIRHLVVATYSIQTKHGPRERYALYLVLRTVVVEIGHFSGWKMGKLQTCAESLASRLGVSIMHRPFDFRSKYISDSGFVVAFISLLAILGAGGFLFPESLLGVWLAFGLVAFGGGYLKLQAWRVRRIADRIAIEEFQLEID